MHGRAAPPATRISFLRPRTSRGVDGAKLIRPTTVGPPAERRLAPFRRVEKRPFRGSLTERRRLGFAATPVSRLFGRRVSRYADSVLMADDDQTRSRAILELSPVTRLKGRGDVAPPADLPPG